MTIEDFRYETYELDAMVSAIEKPDPFLLRTFFPTVVQSTSETIAFDIEEGGRRLAPFVSPLVSGKPVRGRGYFSADFTPAYIKPISTVRPGQAFTRRAGEPFGGTMTPKERADRLTAEAIMTHEEMIDNRLEWMAAQALVLGQITVEGDDYPSQVVSFNRSANLSVTLGVGVKWSETNGVPLDDIEALAIAIRKESFGAVADTLVMDGQAWKYFRKKMEGNVQFSTQQRLGSSSLETGPRNNIDGQYVGQLAGRFAVWVYDGHYEDDAGVMQPMIPANTCLVLSAPAIDGRQYFGAIQDMESGLLPMKHFVKTRLQWDPSSLEVLSQSAPLVAPKRRNAYGRIVVHS